MDLFTDLLMEILEVIITIPIVLVALTFHEYSHGLIAYKLGDPTAKYMGRLTLNPLKHLDLVGTLCMIVCRFGWAKPVPVDMRQFKNPKRGMAICAIAGPLSNLLLGFIGTFIFWLLVLLFPNILFNYYLRYFLSLFAILNIYLAIFNLIPLPPFDGSRVLTAFLPDKYYIKLLQNERKIALGFFLILILDGYVLGGFISSGLATIVDWIFSSFISFFNLFVWGKYGRTNTI